MKQDNRLCAAASPGAADERTTYHDRISLSLLLHQLLLASLLLGSGAAQQQAPPQTSCTASDVAQTGGLRKVECNRMQLDTIPDAVLVVPSGTEALLLPNNRIASLGGRSAAALGRLADSLQELDLSNNYLEEVPPDAFANMTKLRKVNLSKNRLRRMPTGFITSAPYIEELNLTRNQFPVLSERFLQGMPRLQRLVLADCSIEEIRPDAFAALTTSPFVELDISANQLEHLDATLLDDILKPTLTKLRLYDNFWRCDCRLRWLRSAVNKPSVRWTFEGDTNVPKCEEPKRLKHKSWLLVTDDEFGCKPSAVEPRQKRLSFLPGTRMTLACTFDSDPPPQIVRWWHDGASLDESHRYMLSMTRNGSLTTALLSVPSATARDDGQYACAATSKFGTDNASIVVTVSATANADTAESTGSGNGMHVTTIVAMIVAAVAVIAAVVTGIYCARRRAVQSGTYINVKDEGLPMLVQSPSGGSSAYRTTTLGLHDDDGYPAAAAADGEQHETSLLYASAAPSSMAASSSALAPAAATAKAILSSTAPVAPPDVIKLYPDDQPALQEPLMMLGRDAVLLRPLVAVATAPMQPVGADPVSEYPQDDAGYREYNAYLAMIAEPRAGIAATTQEEADEDEQDQVVTSGVTSGPGFSMPLLMPTGSLAAADDSVVGSHYPLHSTAAAALGAMPSTPSRAGLQLHHVPQQQPPTSASVASPLLAHGSMLNTIPEENSI